MAKIVRMTNLTCFLFSNSLFSFSVISYFPDLKQKICGDLEMLADFQQQTVNARTTITVAGIL